MTTKAAFSDLGTSFSMRASFESCENKIEYRHCFFSVHDTNESDDCGFGFRQNGSALGVSNGCVGGMAEEEIERSK